MMDYLAIAGADLRQLNPLILREPGRDDVIRVVNCPVGRDGVWLWHLEHHIGLTDIPPRHELHRRRRVFRATLGRARISPPGERIDITLAQRAVVRELAYMR